MSTTLPQFETPYVLPDPAGEPAAAADAAGELQSPQKEAAFFFGLFLRGHSADQLRQDIDFPPALLARWRRRHDPQAPSAEELQRLYDFRKRVLAIFNFLVSSESGRAM